MSFLRGTVPHLGLLGLAAALSLQVWLKGEASTKTDLAKVEVWPGAPEQISALEWTGKQQVKLEARSDKTGRYFVGTLKKRVQVLTPGPADAGSEQKPKDEILRFISAKSAEPLMASLAPLRAFRALGSYDPARAEEFGFKELEGTLAVTIAGQSRRLEIGGATPGGADRYAKEVDSNVVYAVPGDILRNLSYADSRLMERDLHGFDVKDIDHVRIAGRGSNRELVRLAEKDAWGNPGSSTADETAGNWIGKAARLRPSEYVEAPPAGLGEQSVVVRVEYLEGSRLRGFLELVKAPGSQPSSEYLVRTEYTRWYAKVLASSAEQVEQDLPSVIR